MSELISVIIPVYNTNISDLIRCLEALSKQSYKCLDILCVDGGSSDAVLKVIQKFVDEDKRFRLLTANKGVSNQRNIGIDASKGDYVLFVDSDDFIDLDFIEKLYLKMQDTNFDIIVPHLVRTEFNHRIMVKKAPYITDSSSYNVDRSNFFEYVRKAGLANPVNLYKKSLISRYRFDVNSSYGEDLLFNYDLSEKGFHCCYCEDAFYYYCVDLGKNSASRRLDEKGITIVKKLYDIYHKIKKHKNKNYIGLCKEFSYNFNIFFYAAAREKNRKLLKKMSRYKWLYLKLNFSVKQVLYVLFPIIIVQRRNKNS